MRWLPMLALGLSLSAPAQAFTLFETEPNDCFCEATPGGTTQTSLLSGVLTDADADYYRFEFASPVAFLSIRPASPQIADDESYRPFDLALFQETGPVGGELIDVIALCEDCWFLAGAVEGYDLPAGIYYVGVADVFGGPPAGPGIPANEGDPPPQSLGLGAYTTQVTITQVPEPASLLLMGTALAGLALRRRRR